MQLIKKWLIYVLGVSRNALTILLCINYIVIVLVAGHKLLSLQAKW